MKNITAYELALRAWDGIVKRWEAQDSNLDKIITWVMTLTTVEITLIASKAISIFVLKVELGWQFQRFSYNVELIKISLWATGPFLGSCFSFSLIFFMKRFKEVLAVIILSVFSPSVFAQGLTWSVFTDSIGNSANGEQSIAIDSSGGVWEIYDFDDYDTIDFPGGISRFSGAGWILYTSHDTSGLMGGKIGNIIRDRNGMVWVSGDSGIEEFSNGGWHSYRVQDGITHRRTYGALAADSNNNIWVACTGNFYTDVDGNNGIVLDSIVPEVYRFDGVNWTSFPIQVWYPGGWGGINSISVSPTGTIWAVGIQYADSLDNFHGGLWRLDGQSWTQFDADDGTGLYPYQLALQPGSIHADNKGGAWISFKSRFDGLSLTNYPPAVNYFNGSTWDTSAVTGSRFADVWLSSNGDQYFASRSAKSQALIIANDAGIKDSVSNIPLSPFFDLEFELNGNIWAACETFSIEEASPTSSVSPLSSSSTLQCSVYPNPMLADAAHISLSGAQSGVYQITLTNTLGIVLKTASVNASGTPTCDLSTSELPSGAYLITIANGAERVTVPVVKE